jgi:hypothetical protein
MFKLFTQLKELKFSFLINNSTEHGRISILLSVMAIIISTKTIFSYNIPDNTIALYSYYVVASALLMTIYYFNYKFIRFMLLQDKKHYINIYR